MIDRLLDAGFKIQRYDSFTSKSIYLKLDYGVCNSIRISDHKGKKHLNYRFNLLSDRYDVNKHNNGSYPRNFYGFGHVNVMINDIVSHRSERFLKYGSERYKGLMQKNVQENKYKKGFWSMCREVIRVESR